MLLIMKIIEDLQKMVIMTDNVDIDSDDQDRNLTNSILILTNLTNSILILTNLTNLILI